MHHVISLNEAIAMTSRYRDHRNNILQPAHQHQDILPLSETFDRAALDLLLSKPGCTAIRIYFGMDESLRVHAVIVASNSENEDILPHSPAPSERGDEDDFVIDRGNRCPPICPRKSPLNE